MNILVHKFKKYASQLPTLHISTIAIAGASVGFFVIGVQTVTSEESKPPQTQAGAEIALCSDEQAVVGVATLTERASDEGVKLVDVLVSVNGLTDKKGKHAVHIHETASCTPCSSAKGHFDPGPHGMTNPDANHPFHSGDLINLEVDEKGSGEMSTTTSRITLSAGPLSIFDDDGSSIIIHVNPDTYCPEGEAAGCAGGGRLACGIFAPKP